ncbi:MFS transporter [Vibrio metschnikovii]|uniref:MFS transporter n=1 Tax=Vibrio metschnikovii TaxID=28172 RepID=UPI001C310FA8|nr:MFS transporter [Vibrio metschnikovii]
MLQIALLLLGSDFVKKHSLYLWLFGTLWVMTGTFIFFDGLNQQLLFPKNTFGLILLFESLMTLSIALCSIKNKNHLLLCKGIVFLFFSYILLINNGYSNEIISAIFVLAYFITGSFAMASAWIVRFYRWKITLAWGIFQMLFSFFILTHHQSTLSFFIGLIMIGTGISALSIATRSRYIAKGFTIFNIINPKLSLDSIKQNTVSKVSHRATQSLQQPLTIHIWTPVGSASTPPLPRPIINRYIAAVDKNGTISTGHASLELPSELYVSLYPEEDIDRKAADFFRLLRATPDNNVPGRFLSDYQTEAADWCESDQKIMFEHYNRDALLNFWESYRQYPIYNITHQNCSSTVAYALEAALEGILARPDQNFLSLLKLMCTPELWIAAQIRRRALMMAWTPGLVMDYSRALHRMVHATTVPWYKRSLWKMKKLNVNLSTK